MKRRICDTVAIDGPAGAGKSTVGRKLAEALGWRYLDTGLMYRALTYLALKGNVSLDNGNALRRLAETSEFAVAEGPEDGLLVNGEHLLNDLRTPRVDAAVSALSAHAEVREVMVRRQREMADAGNIVMVGRDIGTVVLPEACAKLWVTASAHTRAARRSLERTESYSTGAVQAEMERILARDALDSGRVVAPLRQAEDAIVLETDHLTPDEAAATALRRMRELRGLTTSVDGRDTGQSDSGQLPNSGD